MHWGLQCTAPIELPDVGPGDAPKGTSLGPGSGMNAVFTAYDMECWYVMVEYSLVVASIFSFRTMGQWEHWDYYTASTFCISCNIVSVVW